MGVVPSARTRELFSFDQPPRIATATIPFPILKSGSFPNLTPRLHSPFVLLVFALLLLCAPNRVHAQSAAVEQPDTTAELVQREVNLIYQINLERRKAGVPPLRWNRELSESARWFAFDSVDGGLQPTCDHVDSQNRGPGTRMRTFGYTNPGGYGELLVCGFAEAAGAVNGWMNDPTDDYYQKRLMLSPDFREIGAGYYLNMNNSPARGLVAAELSADNRFAPVIINLEAPSSPTPSVSLYIYPTAAAPVEMKISNDPTFAGAQWEPYAAERSWELAEGDGWRTVYVLTRDAANKTSFASDAIFVGTVVPVAEIGFAQATNIGMGYAFAPLPAQPAERVRFSMDWGVDGSSANFLVYRGTAESVPNPDGTGGTALLVRGGDNEMAAQATLTAIPHSYLLTAFFRIMTESNAGTGDVARIAVIANGRQFGPVAIVADDFDAAMQWQEFQINFAIPADAPIKHVELHIERSGGPDIWLDGVRIFSQAYPVTPDLVWMQPNMTVRSQAIHARIEDGDGVGRAFDVAHTPVDESRFQDIQPSIISAETSYLVFTSERGTVTGQDQAVLVCGSSCADVDWSAQSNAPWLHFIKAQEGLLVQVDAGDLPQGYYEGMITLTVAQSQAVDAIAPAAARDTIAVHLAVDGPPPTPLPPNLTEMTWLPITSK